MKEHPEFQHCAADAPAGEAAALPLLRCEFSKLDEMPSWPAHESLLTVVYGERSSRTAGPRLAVANRVLGDAPRVERWRSAQRPRCFRRDPLAWSEDGERLAGVLPCPSSGDLEELSRAHFTTLLDLVAERGYPHLVRIWNYLPAINEGHGDLERYRRFNAGRARAFEERFGSAAAESSYCASTAVGTSGEQLGTAFLATRAPALHLENRRQVPAARYPRLYGPRAPTFSRATIATGDGGAALFVSGTASITGHETVHPGSLADQIDELLRNFDAVIDEARRIASWRIPDLPGFAQVKVYLRHARQENAARARLEGRLPAGNATIFLEADICRADLLVEIEGCAFP